MVDAKVLASLGLDPATVDPRQQFVVCMAQAQTLAFAVSCVETLLLAKAMFREILQDIGLRSEGKCAFANSAFTSARSSTGAPSLQEAVLNHRIVTS